MAGALRGAGYGGAICGSCWQTATFLGHLYNVRSDREAGFIDRHNYGGGNMLPRPGAGLLSAGFQAVADRPYNFSEWAGGGVYGGLDAVPVIGLIGMGVQGWDASAHFASNAAELTRKAGGDVCDRFFNLAMYPAIARALYRRDFTETEPVATRRISIPAMAGGGVGFVEEFSLLGGANIKEFKAAVPQEALAAGPVALEFVDGPVNQPVVDASARFIDRAKRVVSSASGQVRWDYAGQGCITVDTPGTKALVGFGAGREHKLGEATLRTDNALAFIFVGARGPKETVAAGKSLLVTALGRTAIEGEVLDEITLAAVSKPVDPSVPAPAAEPRHLLEPVKAVLALSRKGPCRAYALDHGGRMASPPVELPVENTGDGVRIVLDGAKTRAVHYLLEFAGE